MAIYRLTKTLTNIPEGFDALLSARIRFVTILDRHLTKRRITGTQTVITRAKFDAFPNDANEYLDTDGDSIGNNADSDDDNDNVEDALDAFPLDANESVDTDGDGLATTPTQTTITMA